MKLLIHSQTAHVAQSTPYTKLKLWSDFELRKALYRALMGMVCGIFRELMCRNWRNLLGDIENTRLISIESTALINCFTSMFSKIWFMCVIISTNVLHIYLSNYILLILILILILTTHWRGVVAFTWGLFHRSLSLIWDWIWNLITAPPPPHPPPPPPPPTPPPPHPLPRLICE